MTEKSFKALFFAALISGSALLSACSNVSKGDIKGSGTTPTEPIPSVSSTDPNVPDHVVGSSTTKVTPEVTDPPASMPNQVTTPSTSQTTAKTNSNGEIIDDWKEGLDLTGKESADELYAAFGVDKSQREQYYKKISGEYEFPIIHVSTENKQEVLSREEYVNCFVEVFNCDEIYEMSATSAEIRVRGNASAHYGNVSSIRSEGAPYRIKFTEKQSMLGLNDFARCRSWVLLRVFGAAVKDHMAYNIAKAVNGGDYYVSDSTFIQLYINEKYMGVYVLCEQTQVNSNRIDVTEPKEGYEGTDIGYLVELDNYAEKPYFYYDYNKEKITDVYGTSRVPRRYSYSVKSDTYSDEQLDYIERFFDAAWMVSKRAIVDGEYYKLDADFNLIPAQGEFNSAYECISAVIDIQSVVDMYITYEITNDQDVGGGSFFFAVDFAKDAKMKRLTMVAPWDFDWGYYDYSSSADGGLYAAKFKDSYFVEHWGDRSNPWLILFYSADWFQDLVKKTWRERVSYINAAINDVEKLVENYGDEFNKDGTRRSGAAMTTVRWARNRVEYLNTLWG